MAKKKTKKKGKKVVKRRTTVKKKTKKKSIAKKPKKLGPIFQSRTCKKCGYSWKVGKINVRAKKHVIKCLKCGSKRVKES